MEELLKALGQIGDTSTKITGSLRDVTQGFETFAKNMNTAVSGINAAAKSSDTALGDISSTIDGLIGAGKQLGNIFGTLSDLITPGSSKINQLINDSLSAFENIKDVGMETVKFYDNATSRQRDLQKESYGELAKFGQSFEDIKQNVKIFDDILIANSKMAGSLNISGSALMDMKSKFEQFGVVITDQSQTMRVLGQDISAVQIAYLQSQKAGMSVYEYSQQVSDMMRRQGSSFEGATLTIAGYSEVAEDTGLSVTSMMRDIGSATSSFEKLGVTVSFGKPIMEAFAESVSKIGIGIENASGLATTFSRSLLDVANNYGMAYIISQKAGMDTGGGFLGASIKMQGMFEGASPGEQEEAAVTTAMGMKKFLEDQFGGQIVTRSEAEKSPELGLSFYAQQQTLMSSFGIGDQASATRTLEMLEEIDSALASGDKELADRLSEDLGKQGKAQDELLTETQKMGIAVQGMAIETSIQTALLAAEAKKSLGVDFVDVVGNVADTIGGFYQDMTGDFTDKLKEANATDDTEKRKKLLREVLTELGGDKAAGGEGAAFGRTSVTERENSDGSKTYVVNINHQGTIELIAPPGMTLTEDQVIEYATKEGLAAKAGVTHQAKPKR